MSDAIGSAIFTRLTSDSTLNGYLGGTTGNHRVFPAIAPQNTPFPFLVYEVDRTLPTDTKEGASPVDVRRVNVYGYARKYADLELIKNRVRTLLEAYAGTVNSVVIDGIRLDDEEGPSAFDPSVEAFGFAQVYRIRVKR